MDIVHIPVLSPDGGRVEYLRVYYGTDECANRIVSALCRKRPNIIAKYHVCLIEDKIHFDIRLWDIRFCPTISGDLARSGNIDGIVKFLLDMFPEEGE